MSKVKVLLSLLLAFALAGAATAATEVITVWAAQTASSGTGTVTSFAGKSVMNFQVCGTGFSGTVTFKQGAKTASLATTKTLTLTSYSACTEHYRMAPSSLFQVNYTRSAGTLAYVFVEGW